MEIWRVYIVERTWVLRFKNFLDLIPQSNRS